jgi:alkanesulfonate monooxygenase SsuD/methylene tetrahydromethanopterin reductase-like flavin-dependent oxidoreductase (luciferase family)
VRLGIYLDVRNPAFVYRDWAAVYEETLQHVQDAEELGIPSVWITEHHDFEDGYVSQPLVLAAAIAARTRVIRIGTAVLLLPLRHVKHVAEEAALVDVISRGRLELGLGAGYLGQEFESFGADLDGRFRNLEQGVAELRGLFEAGELLPPPVQSPLPIWIGHSTAVGARRAGRLNVGLLSLDLELVGPYVAALSAAGHPVGGGRMGGVLQAIVARDPERTWEQVKPHLAHQWNTYRAHKAASEGRPPPRAVDPETWRAPGPHGEPPRFEVLTGDELVARLTAFECSPVTDVFLWLSIAAMPREIVEEHLALVAQAAPVAAGLNAWTPDEKEVHL